MGHYPTRAQSQPRILSSSLIFALVCATLALAEGALAEPCSSNVVSSFAQSIAPGTPFVGQLCFQPNYFVFTLSAHSTVRLQATTSSSPGSNSSSDPGGNESLPPDEAVLSHELLTSGFVPLFPGKQPVIGAQSYDLVAGSYGIRVKALLVPDLSFFSIAYRLSLSVSDVSANCANATDASVTTPFTTLPFSISGSLCPSNDYDTFSFYLARTSRLRFEADEPVQVTVTDGQQEQVIVLTGIANAPTTALFLRGNHQLIVSSPSTSFFTGSYTVHGFDAGSSDLPAECDRSTTESTSVSLPFQTSITQCSVSDRAEFRFSLPGAQVLAIQFSESSPGLAALTSLSGQVISFVFLSGNASQQFFLPAGNYILKVPAPSSLSTLNLISDPRNFTLAILTASPTCPTGSIQAGAASNAPLVLLPVNQTVSVCANSSDNLVAGAQTSYWFTVDMLGTASFLVVNVTSSLVATDAFAYGTVGPAVALPAVLSAGRYKIELQLSSPQPTFQLTATQYPVKTNSDEIQLPFSINSSATGFVPVQFFFSLNSASRVTIAPSSQDTPSSSTPVPPLPITQRIRVQLFERCGWSDVCALFASSRAAVDFYPGLFPDGNFAIDLPINEITSVDLASGNFGISVFGFSINGTAVPFSLSVSAAEGLGCTVDSAEPNNSPATASALAFNTSVTGNFCPGDDRDFYQLNASASEQITITFSAGIASSLFIVNRFDASKFIQLASSRTSVQSSLVLTQGAWLLLVVPSRVLVTAISSSASTSYSLTVNATPDTCTIPAQSATASALPFAGNLTSLCASGSANTSFTLQTAATVDIIVLSPTRLSWTLRNAAGTAISMTDDPALTLPLQQGSFVIQVFGSNFNASDFQLFIVPASNTSGCAPDEFEPNNQRSGATPITLPFTAQLSTCDGTPDWFSFSLSFLSRLSIVADRGDQNPAAVPANSAFAIDVCFTAYSGNDTVPLFSSCGAASHTLSPASYFLQLDGSATPYNISISAVPAVGGRDADAASSLTVPILLSLIVCIALLSLA